MTFKVLATITVSGPTCYSDTEQCQFLRDEAGALHPYCVLFREALRERSQDPLRCASCLGAEQSRGVA